MALRHATTTRHAAVLWRLPALTAAATGTFGASATSSSSVLLPAPLRGLARAAASAAGAVGPTESFPVVVAGGGPVGITTALLLSRYGVPCLLLERDQELTDHPRAHFINHRTMEIFRGFDGGWGTLEGPRLACGLPSVYASLALWERRWCFVWECVCVRAVCPMRMPEWERALTDTDAAVPGWLAS